MIIYSLNVLNFLPWKLPFISFKRFKGACAVFIYSQSKERVICTSQLWPINDNVFPLSLDFGSWSTIHPPSIYSLAVDKFIYLQISPSLESTLPFAGLQPMHQCHVINFAFIEMKVFEKKFSQ
jgi:hypothetical protein